MSTVTQKVEMVRARRDFATLHRLMVLEKLHEGSWGHLSFQLPGAEPRFLVSPGQTHWSSVRASDVLLLDGDGKVIEGTGRPNPSAWAVHGPIHRGREDAACILHTHMPYATALTLRAEARFNDRADQNAAYFYGRHGFFDDYEGVVLDQSEGERMARALGSTKTTLFLKNRGVLFVDRSIGMAFTMLYCLERACMAQVLAQTRDHRIDPMPEAAALQASQYEGEDLRLHFEAMFQVLDRSGCDYAD